MPDRLPADLVLTIGHGTENDFLLLSDPDGQLELAGADVARLCDRRAGIGGDGLIRAVRSRALGGAAIAEGAAALAEDPAAEWFMDYRNADGSVAEMCGNGVRVFVAYLEQQGLVSLAEDGELAIGTRGGVRRVRRAPEGYTVDMGTWSLPGGQAAVDRGYDAVVEVPGLTGPRAGLRVDIPNPHTVLVLPDLDELGAADLSRTLAVDPPPAHGTNVELVVPLGEEPGAGGLTGSDAEEPVSVLRMRVQERGVGETRSCGTGICAAVVAMRAWGGPESPRHWRVRVPGGEVTVVVTADDRVELTGPAVLVAEVRLLGASAS